MVQPLNELRCQIGLWGSRVSFAKQRLAMQVREFNDIVVDDRKLSDSRARKCGNDRAADSTRADNGHLRAFQLSLPDAADLRQNDVPRVAAEFVVGEGHRPVEPKPPAPLLVSPS